MRYDFREGRSWSLMQREVYWLGVFQHRKRRNKLRFDASCIDRKLNLKSSRSISEHEENLRRLLNFGEDDNLFEKIICHPQSILRFGVSGLLTMAEIKSYRAPWLSIYRQSWPLNSASHRLFRCALWSRRQMAKNHTIDPWGTEDWDWRVWTDSARSSCSTWALGRLSETLWLECWPLNRSWSQDDVSRSLLCIIRRGQGGCQILEGYITRREWPKSPAKVSESLLFKLASPRLDNMNGISYLYFQFMIVVMLLLVDFTNALWKDLSKELHVSDIDLDLIWYTKGYARELKFCREWMLHIWIKSWMNDEFNSRLLRGEDDPWALIKSWTMSQSVSDSSAIEGRIQTYVGVFPHSSRKPFDWFLRTKTLKETSSKSILIFLWGIHFDGTRGYRYRVQRYQKYLNR